MTPPNDRPDHSNEDNDFDNNRHDDPRQSGIIRACEGILFSEEEKRGHAAGERALKILRDAKENRDAQQTNKQKIFKPSPNNIPIRMNPTLAAAIAMAAMILIGVILYRNDPVKPESNPTPGSGLIASKQPAGSVIFLSENKHLRDETLTRKQSENHWIPLKKGASIYSGDRLRTTHNIPKKEAQDNVSTGTTIAAIHLTSGSNVDIGAETELILSVPIKKDSEEITDSVTLTRGRIYMDASKQDKPLDIRTPEGRISVKEATIEIRLMPGTTELQVASGTAKFFFHPSSKPVTVGALKRLVYSSSDASEPKVAMARAIWRGRRPPLIPSFKKDHPPIQVAETAPTIVEVDTRKARHEIDPRIYGLAFADTEQLKDLNTPINCWGGNANSRYNWKQNASNRAQDWFFQSISGKGNIAGADADHFILKTKSAKAQVLLSIPMLKWVAKLGPNRSKLASFSIKKYGQQQKTDQWFPDSGNGLLKNGSPILGNDPRDANIPADVTFQRDWIRHLLKKWGPAKATGVRYYKLDNEYGLWHVTHRDVRPVGVKMEEVRDRMLEFARMLKNEDPGALILGPEAWGWTGYHYSGYDLQWGNKYGWGNLPDRAQHGEKDYIPWLLTEIQRAEKAEGRRLLDMLSVHFYPQGGEFGKDVSIAMQRRRNRSTRALWDPTYQDESWIKDTVRLIPRLKSWAAKHSPALPVAITEYNWGAENHINGATTQADILGIFGREGLDLAVRWSTPKISTPVYNAFKLFRNYDGKYSAFGNISVSTHVKNPDQLSAFSAERSSDGALTVVLVHKELDASQSIEIRLNERYHNTKALLWQLSSKNQILKLADAPILNGKIRLTVPAQSITMAVIPGSSRKRP